MDSGRRLLLLTRSFSRAAMTMVGQWRQAGVHVEVACGGAPEELVAKLDAEAWAGIALWSPDAGLEHALARSLRQQRTPIVVFWESDEGLTSGAQLDLPFHDDPATAPAPDEEAWHAAIARLNQDPRVRFVFRSKWHERLWVERVGTSPARNTTVIPAGLWAPARERQPPARPLLVLFTGVVSTERRFGADLFVRSALELKASSFAKRLEFAVIAEQVRDERVLQPLAGLPLRRLSLDDGWATSTLCLVTARDGSRLYGALESAAHGVVPVTLTHPALKEILPGSTEVSDDPAAVATAVRGLLLKPSFRLTAAQRNAATLNARYAPAAAREAELNLFEEVKLPARKRTGSSACVLTVGVPSWNAARYLERCVTSIVRGDPTGTIEVIIVDDGSTDSTHTFAEQLAARNGRLVRVVRQENKGHGGAINTALQQARGEFFRVVDADDFVNPVAMHQLAAALPSETADLVLTGYAEDRPLAPLAAPVKILGRLPAGALTRFETILDPLYGLTSWGPLLSTSTFRTSLLRKAAFKLTEHSAYVDLEYCTFGLEFVETIRHLPLDLYRYSLGVEGQSVNGKTYRKRFREHEAVIMRLCEFVRDRPTLSPIKRRYISERVIAPVVAAHLEVLSTLVADAGEVKGFRGRMAKFPFVSLPANRPLRQLAKRAVRSAVPEHLLEVLTDNVERSPRAIARELGHYVLPGAITAFFRR